MVKVSGVMLNYWKNPWRNLIIPNSVTGLFFVSYHLFDIHSFLLTDSPIFYRLICAHWDPTRFEAIKAAYERRYEEPLEIRMRHMHVACKMSKEYQDLLQSIANPEDLTPPP